MSVKRDGAVVGKRKAAFWAVALSLLALEVALLAVVYLRETVRIAGGLGFPLDDSWIHSHFARNIAEGRGIVYNPGQHVSSTSILYSILLAAVYYVIRSPITAADALGLALHLGAGIFILLSARELGLSRLLSFVSAAIFLAVPRLVWGALSGMEVPLYTFLVVLGIYAHLRFRENTGAGIYISTAVFSLAALARPECVVLVGAALIDRFVCAFGDKQRMLRFAKTLPLHVLVACLVIAPAVMFNMTYTGMPLPPSYYAKAYYGSSPSITRLASIAYMYVRMAYVICKGDCAILSFGMLIGLVVLGIQGIRQRRPGLLLMALGFVLVPVCTALGARTGVNGIQLVCQHCRYSAYLVPILILTGMAGIEWTLGKLHKWHRFAVAIAWFVVLAPACISLVRTNAEDAVCYAMEVDSINTMQVALGKWADKLPCGTVLAINDAGAIAFFSRHVIIDIVGVVNPDVLPYLRGCPENRSAAVRAYLREIKPDYIIIFPCWYPYLAEQGLDLIPVKSVFLQDKLVTGGTEMVAYKPVWTEAKDPDRGPSLTRSR